MAEDKDQENKLIERTSYWKSRLEDYTKEYSLNFTEFINNEKAQKFGDELLEEELSRGFNFATSAQFPLISKDDLIFYGIYAQRSDHISKLLAIMEDKEIIHESDVSFGIRAAKVIGDWNDSECVQGYIQTKSGKKEPTRASTEVVLIFHPTKDDKDNFEIQVAQIVDFLRNEAPNLPGGYKIPDIRATATQDLKRLLLDTNVMKSAIVNIFDQGNGNVSTLKQESSFEKQLGGGWVSEDSMINPELHEFLKSDEVQP